MTNRVTICECFARDGLQHEDVFVPTSVKISAIDAFAKAGFSRIEATSYSHPKYVPAFHDASELLKGISRKAGAYYKATCPNVRAVERAVIDLTSGFGPNELSLLVSATEGHTKRNLRKDRATQWKNVTEMVRASGGYFRLVGVISVAFGCPIDGRVDPGRVLADIEKFCELGVNYISLADTTGLGTPLSVKTLFTQVRNHFPEITPIAHFHDTRGMALANCVAALEGGCRHFDSAMGGVGGHPAQIEYGQGYTGNVATEDLVNLLISLGFETGLDLDLLLEASRKCEAILGRQLHSKVARSGFGLIKNNVREHA